MFPCQLSERLMNSAGLGVLVVFCCGVGSCVFLLGKAGFVPLILLWGWGSIRVPI